MTDWDDVIALLYSLGSLCFLVGTVLGWWVRHFGVIK